MVPRPWGYLGAPATALGPLPVDHLGQKRAQALGDVKETPQHPDTSSSRAEPATGTAPPSSLSVWVTLAHRTGRCRDAR